MIGTLVFLVSLGILLFWIVILVCKNSGASPDNPEEPPLSAEPGYVAEDAITTARNTLLVIESETSSVPETETPQPPHVSPGTVHADMGEAGERQGIIRTLANLLYAARVRSTPLQQHLLSSSSSSSSSSTNSSSSSSSSPGQRTSPTLQNLGGMFRTRFIPRRGSDVDSGLGERPSEETIGIFTMSL